MTFVVSDAASDLASNEFASVVWERVLRFVRKSKLRKYELVVDGVRKSGYVYIINTRVGTKLVRFTLLLRSKSSKQMAAYFGKRNLDVIELNCLPKSNITNETILKSLSVVVRTHFIHEFMHYIDAKKFKSKKRYEEHVREIEKQAKRGDVSDRQYFNLDLERNTHYAEIVHELRLKMSNSKFAKRMDTFAKFLTVAKRLQKDFFNHLDDKNKKRVIARLYGMYVLLNGSTDMQKTSNRTKSYISTGGYFVSASDELVPARTGKLLTTKYLRELGQKAIAENRKRGLEVWNNLQKSNLFPRGNYRTPPKGYVRACYCGIYITAENGDQWSCDVGIRGYSACYVTPFETNPFVMLESNFKKREPPKGLRYVDGQLPTDE